MTTRYVGLDVGERHLFGAIISTAAGSAGISFSPDTEPTAVLDWCTRSEPQSVAIDAPPAHSKGLARVGNRRVAEERLGIGGCYGTPRLGSTLPAWMAMGMRCHSTISTAMGQPIVSLRGTGSVFEVHPTYGFRSLLGVENEAKRVRCDPKRLLRPKAPRGSVGHAQRVEILRLLFERLGITWTTALSEKLLSRLDWTDAAMCAALAVLRVQGATQGVGDGTEGTIVIADPSQLGDLVPRILEVVANLSASNRPSHRALRVRKNTSQLVKIPVAPRGTGNVVRMPRRHV